MNFVYFAAFGFDLYLTAKFAAKAIDIFQRCFVINNHYDLLIGFKSLLSQDNRLRTRKTL